MFLLNQTGMIASKYRIPKTIVLLISLFSCNSGMQQGSETAEYSNIQWKVDHESARLLDAIGRFRFIVSIDHARLAEEAGVYTPPSIVSIFSNPEVNTNLIRLNPLTALDLPYKVLCYSEPDTTSISIAYASAAYLMKRHGLREQDITSYARDMNQLLSTFQNSRITVADTNKVTLNYGILLLESDYDFETTVDRLKEVIRSQNDTKWFGEIDFQNEAMDFNIQLGKIRLLLFGAPAPGGQAMFNSPRLGLDAFCQKLLIFEDGNNNVKVAFNDIEDFAKLHYNRATKPQGLINQRLSNTFKNVIGLGDQ